MEAKATAKYIRISPRKARRVVDMIRGQHVEEARRILRFSPLGATHEVGKVLESAVANAGIKSDGRHDEDLFVSSAWVDEGPTLKRFRPRAYGRATTVLKRTSHITLVVKSLEDARGA